MMDGLAIAVDDRLLEADDVDQESDKRMSITGAQASARPAGEVSYRDRSCR